MNKRPLLKIAVLTGMVVLLSGCGTLPGMGGAASSGDGDEAVQIVEQKPEDITRAFLNAWNTGDYASMYGFTSPTTQGMFAYSVFETSYENFRDEVSLESIEYTIRDSQVRGQTAAVTYDVTFNSPIVGEFTDENRIMRLVQNGASWGVAWSTMDIINGLAAGAEVEIAAERQPRGNIYDRNGNLLVEENGTVYELYAQRLSMSDLDECITLMAYATQTERTELLERDASYNADTIYYIADIDRYAINRNATALEEICGVTLDNGLIQTREDRRYVGHGAATHVTGYIGQIDDADLERFEEVGYRLGDLVGKAGVEQVYEEALAGRPARVLRISEPGGTVIRELGGASGIDPVSVTLTIDRDLQLITGTALSDAYNYAAPNWARADLSGGAAAVVLDVNTGAVLALASYPTYDPGLFSPQTPFPFVGAYINELLIGDRSPFVNRATNEQYFPGSSFKIITTIAAAAERVRDPQEIFYCSREWNGQEFGDTLPIRYDWRAAEPEERNFDTGDVTMSQALTASCNPFFYQMGAQLFNRAGNNALTNYARRFGLGESTGIEPIMPEASGIITPPTSVEGAINAAIGQGTIQVTPIQMARMVVAVANGGTLYQPYFVERVGGVGDEPLIYQHEFDPETASDVGVSEAALAVAREGMCNVPTDTRIGTAWFVFPNTPYTVCGKTGTAQTGQLAPHAWFVAYSPADDPQIAVVVMAENSREGSEVAAPIVRRILDRYYGVPFNDVFPFPDWWTGEYVPLDLPEGSTGG